MIGGIRAVDPAHQLARYTKNSAKKEKNPCQICSYLASVIRSDFWERSIAITVGTWDSLAEYPESRNRASNRYRSATDWNRAQKSHF